MFYNQIHQKVEVRDRTDDSSQWYVEIYNLPLHLNKEDVIYFIWKTLEKCRGLKKPTNPVVKSEYIEDLRCIRAFFRSKEETINCLDLNGILYGQKSFYMKSALKARDHPQLRTGSIQIKRIRYRVEDGFNKLCISNFPPMQEYELLNTLRTYGQIKAFEPVLMKNTMVKCFFQYETTESTEECLSKLNNQRIKSKIVSVVRALMSKETLPKTSTTTVAKPRPKTSLFEKGPHTFYLTFDTVGFFKNMKISCVLLLKNMVQSQADREYIQKDIRKEVEKIGKVENVLSKDRNIYIEYSRVEYAQIAYLLLSNRKYDGRNLEISFYDPVKFADDILL